MLGVEFFFKLEFDGGSIGVQHVRSKFFFFSGTADIFLELAHFWLFWSKFSGVNGRNFCEDWTYKKKKKKRKKEKRKKKEIGASPGHSNGAVPFSFFGHQRALVAGFLQFFL